MTAKNRRASLLSVAPICPQIASRRLAFGFSRNAGKWVPPRQLFSQIVLNFRLFSTGFPQPKRLKNSKKIGGYFRDFSLIFRIKLPRLASLGGATSIGEHADFMRPARFFLI
jgi:hypothetical protein